MYAQRCPFVSLVALTILFSAPLFSASAQQRASSPDDFKINTVRQYFRRSPNYGVSATSIGGKGNWASDQWLIIDVDFASDLEWADDILIKYYVLMGSGRSAKLLSGDLTLINVERGGHHYAGMFVHPSTIRRYGRGKVTAVAVQLFHQNRLMAQESDPKSSKRWWEQFTPSPGYLLRPEESAWSVVSHERYEAIKAAR